MSYLAGRQLRRNDVRAVRSLCELSLKCLQFDGQTVEQGANTRFSGDIGEVKNLPGEPILNVHAHHVLFYVRKGDGDTARRGHHQTR